MTEAYLADVFHTDTGKVGTTGGPVFDRVRKLEVEFVPLGPAV